MPAPDSLDQQESSVFSNPALVLGPTPSECGRVDSTEKANILLVDDTAENLTAFEAVLVDLNVRIICAHSGREALQCLLRHEFAVVLLDVNMPEMGGFETAALIR